MQLYLIRGLVAIAWAALFAAVSDPLTTQGPGVVPLWCEMPGLG